MKSINQKRGISPVVATTLLILLVVVIAIIIFLFFRSITREAVTKFGENVEIICINDIDFSASYISGTLSLVNNGNTPIYDFVVQEIGGGSTDSRRLRDIDSTFKGLNAAAAADASLITSSERIILIPVLLGEVASGGTQEHVCDESAGLEILV
jgi:hypothetical protein